MFTTNLLVNITIWILLVEALWCFGIGAFILYKKNVRVNIHIQYPWLLFFACLNVLLSSSILNFFLIAYVYWKLLSAFLARYFNVEQHYE